ncbi:hypothetical protein ACJIZ3_006486 [Penstemon smallii]|uniref:DUF4408 domain-containing protein n=1 Tax=Penstemon smallii TaxID=265156 RepID=A0ABD3S7U5_9LAMI
MGSMNTWILSMKVFLISAGVLSLAVAIKVSIPTAVNGIPTIWSVISTWLKPPYLYILINGIIITIVASSRFHQTQSEPTEQLISVKTPPPSDFVQLSTSQPVISTVIAESDDATAVVVYESHEADSVVELKPVLVNGSQVDVVTEEEIVAVSEGGDVFVDDSTLTYDTSPQEIITPELHQLESLFPVREKPLVSTRFGHRKPIRTTPEVPGGGKLLRRVARPKKLETLESTWKAITDGRHVPLTRHLKKSDTLEQHVTPSAVDHVAKSETLFSDRSSYEQNSSSKIRKEPSLGQEELNRRVEAFIKKINDDMRMQRQESLNQYMEMINRGV